MAATVYLLCFLTSLSCAGLVLRSYIRTRVRLLLWLSLCFIGLTLNNLLLFLDLVVFPDVNLAVVRIIPAVCGVGILAFGLVWDVK